MGQRKIQKEKTLQRILEAAKDEFERMGFENAGIRNIAKAAGVSPGLVIHHFHDKKDLLHAALFEDLQKTISEALKDADSSNLFSGLLKISSGVFTYYEKRPELSRTLLKESLFAKEPWAAKFAGQTTMVHKAVVEMCEKAKKRKEMPAKLDSTLFAVSYLSYFYFTLIAWVQGQHSAPLSLIEKLLAQHVQKEGKNEINIQK